MDGHPRPRTELPPPLRHHVAAIAELCRMYDVHTLDVFGSATTGVFDAATSDFDFVVSFADEALGTLADRYLDLAEGLEALLGRPVDLLTERSIRNPIFRQAVERTRQRVYDRASAQATA